jgi:hypothetical protein
MARRRDAREREMLRRSGCPSVATSLHLSLPAVRDFYEQAYRDRRPTAYAEADPNAGVEAVMEVAIGQHICHLEVMRRV